MSSNLETTCEKPTQNWIYYEETDLRDYVYRNLSKADCSFVLKDSEKVLKSFKWILCDMSPVLKEILNDDTNQGKNCKMIPITDPNFEAILFFGHTKQLDKTFDILDLFESAIKYEISKLAIHIFYEMQNKPDLSSLNWVNCFRLTIMEKKLNWVNMKNIFHQYWKPKKTAHDLERDMGLLSNIEMVADFDMKVFDKFFDFIVDFLLKPLICFQVAEAYILKNLFSGKMPNSPEEIDNLTADLLKSIFNKIKFDQMTLEEFENGPGKSKLIDAAWKQRILKNIKKLNAPR